MNFFGTAGNLTGDAELRFTPGGDPVLSFSVADNQGRDKVIFWRCSWFGSRAEKVAQYLKKGTPVTVTGRLEEKEWTDKNGSQRKDLQVNVNDVALQGRASGEQQQQSAPTQQAQRTPPTGAPSKPSDDFSDDIPF
jgi:single-strand DNA-binding protein